jgi:hypothetical protein
MSAIFATRTVDDALALGNATGLPALSDIPVFSGICYFGNCMIIDVDKIVNMPAEVTDMIRKALKNPAWFPDFSYVGNKIIVSLDPYTQLPITIYECTLGMTTACINCIYGNPFNISFDISSILEFFVYKTQTSCPFPDVANNNNYTVYYYSPRNISTYTEDESYFKYTLNTFHSKRLSEPMFEFSSVLKFDETFTLCYFMFAPTTVDKTDAIPLLHDYNSFSLFTTGHNIKTFGKLRN